MAGPNLLSRPLAARVANLSDPAERLSGPDQLPAVVQAACDALDAGKTKYTDRPGILPLRAWVATSLNSRYGLAMSPDEVTITCGGTEARFVAVKKLVAPGTQLLCPGDAGMIAGPVALVGATIVSQVDNPAAISTVYVTATLDQAVLDSVLEQVREHGWWVIWDMSPALDAATHPAQDTDLAPRVVSIGSLSHAMPGWRIGWMAGSEQAQQLRAYKQSMTICSPSISQWAAAGLVDTL